MTITSVILFLVLAVLVVFLTLFCGLVYGFWRRRLLFPTSSSRIFKDVRPSFTAEMVMIDRAIGTMLTFCNDPFAYEFCDLDAKIWCRVVTALFPVVGYKILWNVPYMSTRTIFFDDFVQKSQSEQVVILGAGLDSRAYRLPMDGRKVRFFEVDAPATQKLKKDKVMEVFQKRPDLFVNPAYLGGNVTYVTCNFAEESFLDKLIENGFDPKNPRTAILLEGVASYLTWDQLKGTLSLIAKCAPGTQFAMNVLTGGALKSGFSRLLKDFVGEEWKFSMASTETAQEKFSPLGFEVLRETSFADAQGEIKKLAGLRRPKLLSKMIFMKVAEK